MKDIILALFENFEKLWPIVLARLVFRTVRGPVAYFSPLLKKNGHRLEQKEFSSHLCPYFFTSIPFFHSI